jgi:hypothetical protein
MFFIPLGLAVLAIEFAWARQWLRRLKEVSRDPSQLRSWLRQSTIAR